MPEKTNEKKQNKTLRFSYILYVTKIFLYFATYQVLIYRCVLFALVQNQSDPTYQVLCVRPAQALCEVQGIESGALSTLRKHVTN